MAFKIIWDWVSSPKMPMRMLNFDAFSVKALMLISPVLSPSRVNLIFEECLSVSSELTMEPV